MATIIDFSPTAGDIKKYIDAADKSAIKPPEQPVDAIVGSPASKRNVSKKFFNQSPDILFVADYRYDQYKLAALIVWENYYSATHYEIHKRNRLSTNKDWERILFLNATTLTQETKNFQPYIEQVLGLKMNQNTYYAILDKSVSADAIYEYKVGAGYYPQSADIDYELIFESKGRNKWVDINVSDTIFELSTRLYGVRDFSWVISLFNKGCYIFGSIAAAKTVKSAVFNDESIVLPKDLGQVVRAFCESVYFFGLKASIRNMLNRMADTSKQGEFFDEVINAIDEKKKVLSYNNLNNRLITISSAYADAVKKIRENNVTNTTLLIPQYDDQYSFDSVADLTIMFERLLSIFTAYVYGSTHKVTPSVFVDSSPTIGTGGKPVATPSPTTRPLAIPTVNTNPISSLLRPPVATPEKYPIKRSDSGTRVNYQVAPSKFESYDKRDDPYAYLNLPVVPIK